MNWGLLIKATSVPTLGAGLLLGAWITSRPFSQRPEASRSVVSAPRALFAHGRQDFGVVSQGVVLRSSFPITNAGSRRLVIVEETDTCCGQSADPNGLTVLPGESKCIEVEVDTGRWHGRVQRTFHFTTNDPKLPRFAFTVSAIVQSP